MSINKLGEEAHQVNQHNCWDVFVTSSWPKHDDYRDIKTDKIRFLCTHMALIHSEVSEATEAIRKYDRLNFNEEMADIAIRVASIAYGLGIDLEAEMKKKIEKNKTRGVHHGGKAV